MEDFSILNKSQQKDSSMYGVIDVGSNTIRLCIYDVSGNEIYPMLNNKTTAGLAGYVKKGKMTKKGIQKACDVLNKYREMMEHFPLKELFVFATASLRNISNTDEALQTITAETGLSIDVLTGYQEATFDFIGAAHSINLDRGLLLDIGGGSTELLVYERGEIQNAVSLTFGSLSMFSNYVSGLFPTKKEKKEIEDVVKKELKKIKFLNNKTFDNVIGIGGSIRAAKNMNNYIFEKSKDNSVIIAEDVPKLLKQFRGNENEVLKTVLKVSPDRVHTLIPGMIVMNAVCEYVECKDIIMSPYGVREGYLYQKLFSEQLK